MSRYDNFSREELISRIKELEDRCTINKCMDKREIGWFRDKYADKILDAIPDMLTVFDRDGNLIDLVSAAETNHTGVPLEALAHSNIDTLLEPDSAHNVRNNLNNVFSSGRWSMSNHHITIDNDKHYYENRIFPLSDEHALCMCRDITTERLARQELETLQYAMNNLDEEVYACDLDGTMIYANERFRKRNNINNNLSNYKIYEFGLSVTNRQHWEDLLQKIRGRQDRYKETIRFKDNTGEPITWSTTAYIMFNANQEKEMVWFFCKDVTVRYIQEKKIKEINSIMDSILSNIPVYIFVKDPGNDFRYLYWNKAFEEYSKIPSSKALGNTDFEIFPDQGDAQKFRQDDLNLLRTGERILFTEDYTTAEGETRTVTTTKSLVVMENRPPLIIGVSWDITEHKRAEREIMAARIKAEESDRLKTAFLANMSHEIRTPLNAIVGFSKLINEVDSEEEKKQYADIIDSNSDLLLQLINDILDLSKIEAGTLDFNYKKMELNEFLRGEYEIFKNRVKENVQLIYDNKYDNIEIDCDQNRLAQVVTNLLANACKFTFKGEIRFGFEPHDNRIDFYVSDTGIGIASDKKNHIFERFVKLDNFAVGTGLGLSISKMIVERMGGKIRVESTKGEGSRFRFSIPRYQKNETIQNSHFNFTTSTNNKKLQNGKILIAEDIESNFLLVKALLSDRFDLIWAKNGKEAIDMFHKEHPDIILMDMKMPIMDGFQATRILRKEAIDIPIIAMSAFASIQDQTRALQIGCNKYITKPISFDELNKTLNDYFDK